METLFTKDEGQCRALTVDEERLMAELVRTHHEEGFIDLMTAEQLDELHTRHSWYFISGILIKRLKLAPPDMKFSTGLVLFAAVLSTRPSDAVLWAWTLVRETYRLKRPLLSNDWLEAQPQGVPSEERYRKLWKQQKINGQNYLDMIEAYSEITHN